MPQVVKIRSTDAAAAKAVRKDDSGIPIISWSQDLGNRFGTAMVGLSSDLGFRPGEDDYVEITRVDGVTREFSGFAVMPRGEDVPGRRVLNYEIQAQGFGAVLDRIPVTAAINWPADMSDRKMVDDLLALYWGPIGTGITHAVHVRRIRMPAIAIAAGTSLRSALDAIAKEAWDAPWWVDADKKLHWNDGPAAPYVLWAPATGGALKPLTDASFASFERLGDARDGAQKAIRVRVVGAAAVEATVTDWPSWGRVARRLRDEPLAPTARFWQLPDVTDNTLTTVAQCEQRGFAELAKNGSRRTLPVDVKREGFAVGQRVDLVDEEVGTLAGTLPRWTRGWRSSSGKRLYKGQGRFRIQRIEATAVGEGEYSYALELGQYTEPLAVGLARS